MYGQQDLLPWMLPLLPSLGGARAADLGPGRSRRMAASQDSTFRTLGSVPSHDAHARVSSCALNVPDPSS